jgi:ADP-ribose pyrophosphatase YjhB (NUDIX family)
MSEAIGHGFEPTEAPSRRPAHGEVKVNVDTVLITLRDHPTKLDQRGKPEKELCVALAPRETEPFKGRLALVGAIMDGNRDDDLDAVVTRSLRDKAGLENVYFEQLYTFSGRSNRTGGKRDVRWPSVSVAYIALVPMSRLVAEGAASHGIELVPVDQLPSLPFDHADIVEAAVSRLRGKGAWSVLPAYLLDEEFTLPQLNAVYSAVVGSNSLGESFRRKVLGNNLLEPVGYRATPGATRKAEHYRIKPGVSTVDTRL